MFVYYEEIKREFNRRLMYECRCDSRLKGKSEEENTTRCYMELVGLWKTNSSCRLPDVQAITEIKEIQLKRNTQIHYVDSQTQTVSEKFGVNDTSVSFTSVIHTKFFRYCLCSTVWTTRAVHV